MALTLDTPPSVEPVSRSEQKTHSRIDSTFEDSAIDTYISAARWQLENEEWKSYVETVWKLVLDDFPRHRHGHRHHTSHNHGRGHNPSDYHYDDDDVIYLPRPPLLEIVSFTYTDDDGNTVTMTEGDDYQLASNSKPARLLPPANESWPDDVEDGVEKVVIKYKAGYTSVTSGSMDNPEKIPAQTKAAVKQLAGHFIEHRVPVSPASANEIPWTVRRLLDPFRDKRVIRFM